MELKELLTQKRKAILERWLNQILKTYPSDAARFMGRQADRFANPVGQTFKSEIEKIFDVLIGRAEIEIIESALENINKIRAVQDFSAAQAVAFIFFLKTAIREELAGELNRNNLTTSLLSLESQIDGLALNTFDSYMKCREKLFEVKCNEIRRRAMIIGSSDSERN
jgi:hypothetical protein